MSQYDEVQVSEWLRDGIAAAKASRREEARELLLRVVEANERSEQAWLWLSSVVDADEDRLVCLENVLTLNPNNAQARAGLRLLREQGLVPDTPASEAAAVSRAEFGLQEGLGGEDAIREVEELERIAPYAPAPAPVPQREPDLFMTPDGCVYCGLVVDEHVSRCPHCGGRLTTKQFKKDERSAVGYLLHAYWVLLAGVGVADYFLIGYIWNNTDGLPRILNKYLHYAVGPIVTGEATIETFIGSDTLTQIVRYTLLGLAILGVLDALGLFFRRPLAHMWGVVLIALHLIVGLSLFAIGFLGYLMAAFRAALTVLLTVFMFNTVEDFAKEERRELLEPDRHLLNDADFYARGRVYEKRGMWAKALLHWRRAAAENPEKDTYFASIARAYARLGRYEQAVEHIDEALRISRTPEDWQPMREIILEAQRRAAGRPKVTGSR